MHIRKDYHQRNLVMSTLHFILYDFLISDFSQPIQCNLYLSEGFNHGKANAAMKRWHTSRTQKQCVVFGTDSRIPEA